jgi:Trk K+ transport system NAD-binding subunit
VPNGDTILSAGDRLLVLADKEELVSLRSRIEQVPPTKLKNQNGS